MKNTLSDTERRLEKFSDTECRLEKLQNNQVMDVELDRYIGNTYHRGRSWDNRNHRNHRQMMTIGDQSVPMFHDDVTH